MTGRSKQIILSTDISDQIGRGKLILIKVLTCAEFIKLTRPPTTEAERLIKLAIEQRRHKYKIKNVWRYRRACCTYFMRGTPPVLCAPKNHYCMIKGIQPDSRDCRECKDFVEHTGFKIKLHIKPIEIPDNIPLPPIHASKDPHRIRERDYFD